MIRRLYDWTLGLAQHRHALWALAVVAFVESSFFPIPPDILMIPMIIARPNRAWLIAGVALLASVLGGLLGGAGRRGHPLPVQSHHDHVGLDGYAAWSLYHDLDPRPRAAVLCRGGAAVALWRTDPRLH